MSLGSVICIGGRPIPRNAVADPVTTARSSGRGGTEMPRAYADTQKRGVGRVLNSATAVAAGTANAGEYDQVSVVAACASNVPNSLHACSTSLSETVVSTKMSEAGSPRTCVQTIGSPGRQSQSTTVPNSASAVAMPNQKLWYRGLCCESEPGAAGATTTLRLSTADVTFPALEFAGRYVLAGMAIVCATHELFVALHQPGKGVFVVAWEDGYFDEPRFVGPGTCCLYSDLLYRIHEGAVMSWELGTPLAWTYVMAAPLDAWLCAGSPDLPDHQPSLVVCSGQTVECIPGPTWTFSEPVTAAAVSRAGVWVLTATGLFRDGIHQRAAAGATALRVFDGQLLVVRGTANVAIIPL